MLSDWLSKDRSGPLTTLVVASEPTGEIPVSMSATVVAGTAGALAPGVVDVEAARHVVRRSGVSRRVIAVAQRADRDVLGHCRDVRQVGHPGCGARRGTHDDGVDDPQASGSP